MMGFLWNNVQGNCPSSHFYQEILQTKQNIFHFIVQTISTITSRRSLHRNYSTNIVSTNYRLLHLAIVHQDLNLSLAVILAIRQSRGKIDGINIQNDLLQVTSKIQLHTTQLLHTCSLCKKFTAVTFICILTVSKSSYHCKPSFTYQ